MNNRKATIIKLCTCYGVLFSHYKIDGTENEKQNVVLFDKIFSVLDYYVYNKNSKEADKLVKAIQEINKIGEYIKSTPAIVLSMLNGIIEMELIQVKNINKFKALNELQELIINHTDYNFNGYGDFEKSEEIEKLINEQIKKYC